MSMKTPPKVVILTVLLSLMICPIILAPEFSVKAQSQTVPLVVTGSFAYGDKGVWPIPNAFVRLFIEPTNYVGGDIILPPILLQEGYTDSNGRYSFTVMVTQKTVSIDGMTIPIKNFYTECYTINPKVKVLGNPEWMGWTDLGFFGNLEGAPYRFPSERKPITTPVTDLGPSWPQARSVADDDEAFNVFIHLNHGWDFINTYANPAPLQITAFWDDTVVQKADESFCLPKSIPKMYSLPDESVQWVGVIAAVTGPVMDIATTLNLVDKSWEALLKSEVGIHIKDGDGWRADVIYHELGHWAMDHYASLWPPKSETDHVLYGHYTLSHAYVEGWAHFFSAVAREWLWKGTDIGPYDQNSGWLARPYNIEENIHLVDPAWYNQYGTGENDTVEAYVAGILWDLYDGANEKATINGRTTEDMITMGFSPLWNAMASPQNNVYPNDIYDFRNRLMKSNGDWAVSKKFNNITSALWNIFNLHGIPITDNSPPIVTSYSSDAQPMVNWQSNYISITYTAWDTANLLYSDRLSGFVGMNVTWNHDAANFTATNSSTIWNEDGNIRSPALPDGVWYAHLNCIDYAGNWATKHIGPFYINYPMKITDVTNYNSGPATISPLSGSKFTYSFRIMNTADTALIVTLLRSGGSNQLTYNFAPTLNLAPYATTDVRMEVAASGTAIILYTYPFSLSGKATIAGTEQVAKVLTSLNTSVTYNPSTSSALTSEKISIQVQPQVMYSTDARRVIARVGTSLVNANQFTYNLYIINNHAVRTPFGSYGDKIDVQILNPTIQGKGEAKPAQLAWFKLPYADAQKVTVYVPQQGSMNIGLTVTVPDNLSPGVSSSIKAYYFNANAKSLSDGGLSSNSDGAISLQPKAGEFSISNTTLSTEAIIGIVIAIALIAIVVSVAAFRKHAKRTKT
jgi:hypothetical protein